MTELLEVGFTDTLDIYIQKKKGLTVGGLTWEEQGRKNVGWRIDYFIVSNNLEGNIKEAIIYPEIMGSDHLPNWLKVHDVPIGDVLHLGHFEKCPKRKLLLRSKGGKEYGRVKTRWKKEISRNFLVANNFIVIVYKVLDNL